MDLDLNKINAKLNTIFFGRNIKYYNSIDSTQDEAKRLSKKEDISDGTYIVANTQKNGKGTHNRKWYDKSGENICGTFILKPSCHIKKIEGITILIANSLIKSIKKSYNIDLQIKYPNDIIYNNKKICGILTESITNADIVQYIYIGIGMNVNQTVFNKELLDIATSLKKEQGHDFSREDIIAEFCNIFEKEYLNLIKN